MNRGEREDDGVICPRIAALAACCGLVLAGCEQDRPAARPKRASKNVRAAATRPRAGAPETKPARPASAPATAPGATQPASAPADPALLAAAIDAITKLEQRGDFSEAWKLTLETRSRVSGQLPLDSLTRLLGRLRIEKRQAAQLANAVRLLGSDLTEASQIAAGELADAGDIGRVLLRKAVREGPDRVAVQAARVLTRLEDPNAPALFWQMLQGDRPPPLREALLAGLHALAAHLPAEALGEMYRATLAGTFAEHRQTVGILAAAFQRAGGADPDRFGRLLGEPEAHEKLTDLVKAATSSDDQAVAAAAGEALADLGVLRRGLRGSYYDGTDFHKLLFERQDARIDIPDGKLPYPDGGQENRSIRWTGKVRIPVAGEYEFIAAADDGVRLWVADKKLVDQWTTQAVTEFSGRITLPEGLHPIKLEYFQGGGSCEVHLFFKGPGLDKQLLTDKHLVTTPWQGAAGGGAEKPK